MARVAVTRADAVAGGQRRNQVVHDSRQLRTVDLRPRVPIRAPSPQRAPEPASKLAATSGRAPPISA
jgi:hypothetical protein